MFYFVNQYFLSSNSSIEHSEIKRLNLFRRNDTPAKLVTLDFDPIIHATLVRFGLTDDQLVNLYDFFGQMTDYKGKALRPDDLDIPGDYQVGSGSNSQDVTDGDRLVARLYFIGGTVGQIDHIDYYDQAGNITVRQRYDIRGFKAADVFFGQDGRIHNERYYRPDGQMYLEKYYVQSVKDTPINSLNVLNYKGHKHYFDGPTELMTFFLDELNNANNEKNVFVADRAAISIPTIAGMQSTDIKKYISITFNHVAIGQDPVKGELNVLLKDALTKNAAKWDGVIADTAQQAADLKKRSDVKLPIYHINATPVPHVPQKIAMAKRRNNQILYVGRLGEDKGTSKLISIFDKVRKKVPDASLGLFGYGTPADTKRYVEQISKAKLNDRVIMAGYKSDVEQSYDGAQIFVDTGISDAQPLAMGEALSHGVPVVSFDYQYGPAEMIKPGVNGELVPLGDDNKMVKTIVDLLKNHSRLQKLSDGAYDNLDDFDNKATWAQWQTLIKDAEK